jgi:glycosyltransferase involved in cell wall biosynthesis
VATHAADCAVPAPLRALQVGNYEEMRALVFAAAIALLPRRAAGGFPIKLLGYMQAARPIVAFRGVADGLVDGESAALLRADATPEAFAEAINALVSDPTRAARLGAGARAQLHARHDWRSLARRTLALLAQGRATSLAA